MKTLFAAVILLTLAGQQCRAASGGWSVIAKWWRPDANPFVREQVWEGTFWSEGWSEPEQFYPEHFRAAGSVHLLLRNTSPREQTLVLTHINGQPLEECATTPRKAGSVLWYRLECPQFPVGEIADELAGFDRQSVPAGAWVECTVRFRRAPESNVRLRFRAGEGETLEQEVPLSPPTARIEAITFSRKMDAVYVYVRSLDGKSLPPGTLRVDGLPPARVIWQKGPRGSGLLLAEARLAQPLRYGTFHLFTVTLGDGRKLAQAVRAWDGFFTIGLYGTVTPERVAAAKAKGFNSYFNGPLDVLDNAQMSYVPHGGIGHPVRHSTHGRGLLFYQNHDEPDAHDVKLGEELPWMDRLGTHAMFSVLPLQRRQRQQDRATPNLLLVNNTYKPLNWYVYGQIPDVFCTDPYVPLGGRQTDYVWRALECARDASTPRPLVAVLWACSLDSGAPRNFGRRPPTAREERAMAFYAIGSGVKGISYFIDLTQETGEGQFTGISDYPELWEEVGRINRDIAELAPALAMACPAGPPQKQGPLWVRTLMSGRDTVIVSVVNTEHYIGYETRTLHAFHRPVRDERVRVQLPPGFGHCRVVRVEGGRKSPAHFTRDGDTLEILLGELDTAAAFLVTR
ncbi:MAG: hypothetical protein WHZ52_02380 [Armatimonadota bacterium]